MNRLGFAVKVLGRSDLKSHDTRRWQSAPHLSVSLGYLRQVLAYLGQMHIRMYRFSSDLAPYLTHPDLPQFHRQLDECEGELAAAGALARTLDVRLSVHPGQFVVLNSLQEHVAANSAADVIAFAHMLDLMGLGPEGVMVLHGGSGTEGKEAAIERLVRAFSALPEETRRRVVLENDETVFTVPDLLQVHEATGVRLIFDLLHFQNNNPEGLGALEALRATLATWPAEQTPKIHLSTPRTAMDTQEKKGQAPTITAPDWKRHSDYMDPFATQEFLRAVLVAGLRPFDIMLEAKGKDVALLQLRKDFTRFAPELSQVWD